MRKIILILGALLVSCVTYVDRIKIVQDELQAFAIQEDKLYLIGKNSDYVFENDDIKSLHTFLHSEYAKKILTIDINFYAVDDKIFGEYAVYLDPEKFTTEQKQQLQKSFWFNPISQIKPEVASKIAHWDSKKPALKRQYRAGGRFVRLKNKDKFLTKNTLSKSLSISYEHTFHKQESLVDDYAMLVVAFPLVVVQAVILLPIALVATPLYLLDQPVK